MNRRGDSEQSQAIQVIGGDEPPDPADGSHRPRLIIPVVALLAVVAAGLFLFTYRNDDGEVEVIETTTSAAPLSAPEPVIDVRSEHVENPDVTWARGDLGTALRLTDVTSSNSGFVAVGYDTEGPGLWGSDDGASWRLIDHLETPPGVDPTNLWQQFGVGSFAVRKWQDMLVVLGQVDQRAGVWLDTGFQRFIGEPGSRVGDFVATEDTLVVRLVDIVETVSATNPSQTEVRVDETWVRSSNGRDWDQISPSGLPEVGATGIIWTDGAFYANGACPMGECPTALYRSVDAVNWEKVALELPSAWNTGFTLVTDIAKVADSMLAVGMHWESTSDSFLLHSDAGIRWSRLPPSEEFLFPTTTVQVASIDAPAAIATLSVNDEVGAVTAGSVVITDTGSVEVDRIESRRVTFLVDDGPIIRVGTGSALVIDQVPAMFRIMARDQQVVVAGYIETTTTGPGQVATSQQPAIWLSNDGGLTWTVSAIEADYAWIGAMAMDTNGVALVGFVENGDAAAWYLELPNP